MKAKFASKPFCDRKNDDIAENILNVIQAVKVMKMKARVVKIFCQAVKMMTKLLIRNFPTFQMNKLY